MNWVYVGVVLGGVLLLCCFVLCLIFILRNNREKKRKRGTTKSNDLAMQTSSFQAQQQTSKQSTAPTPTKEPHYASMPQTQQPSTATPTPTPAPTSTQKNQYNTDLQRVGAGEGLNFLNTPNVEFAKAPSYFQQQQELAARQGSIPGQNKPSENGYQTGKQLNTSQKASNQYNVAVDASTPVSSHQQQNTLNTSQGYRITPAAQQQQQTPPPPPLLQNDHVYATTIQKPVPNSEYGAIIVPGQNQISQSSSYGSMPTESIIQQTSLQESQYGSRQSSAGFVPLQPQSRQSSGQSLPQSRQSSGATLPLLSQQQAPQPYLNENQYASSLSRDQQQLYGQMPVQEPEQRQAYGAMPKRPNQQQPQQFMNDDDPPPPPPPEQVRQAYSAMPKPPNQF